MSCGANTVIDRSQSLPDQRFAVAAEGVETRWARRAMMRRFDGWGFSMRSAALTLMALGLLSACAETTDAVAPAYNTGVSYPGYYGTTDNGTPFFTTTDPANFANPRVYAGDPGVLAMAPYYTSNIGYFILPTRKAHYPYCPPRGGRSYSHARGGGRHH